MEPTVQTPPRCYWVYTFIYIAKRGKHKHNQRGYIRSVVVRISEVRIYIIVKIFTRNKQASREGHTHGFFFDVVGESREV